MIRAASCVSKTECRTNPEFPAFAAEIPDHCRHELLRLASAPPNNVVAQKDRLVMRPGDAVHVHRIQTNSLALPTPRVFLTFVVAPIDQAFHPELDGRKKTLFGLRPCEPGNSRAFPNCRRGRPLTKHGSPPSSKPGYLEQIAPSDTDEWPNSSDRSLLRLLPKCLSHSTKRVRSGSSGGPFLPLPAAAPLLASSAWNDKRGRTAVDGIPSLFHPAILQIAPSPRWDLKPHTRMVHLLPRWIVHHPEEAECLALIKERRPSLPSVFVPSARLF